MPAARIAVGLGLVLVLVAPSAFSALSGSGQVEDVVQLGKPVTSIATLASAAGGGSASGAPATSGTSAFTLNNSGSNVDTFVLYGWSGTPYYGTSSQTSITLRGTTHVISDLLWFKQETVRNAGTVASQYFSPLVAKNVATIASVVFGLDTNACTTWTGTADGAFTKSSSGTLTIQYQDATTPANDAPTTSDTFYWCLDTVNQKVYVNKSRDFGAAPLLSVYTENSSNGVLKTYQYQFLSGAQTSGNFYCLTGVTGASTSASPDFAQCQMLPYETQGSTTVKSYVLFDPPAYFPSVNQNGGLTYALSGTQWNPYASSTTQSA